jgi:hypothetical protein
MRIDSEDTFALSWVTAYETPFNYEAQLVVECYANVVHNGSAPILVATSLLKSVAQLSIKRGEAWIYQPRWQMVVVKGEEVMRDFVRHIMQNSMHMSEEEADMVVERVDETLCDGLNSFDSDPRLN